MMDYAITHARTDGKVDNWCKDRIFQDIVRELYTYRLNQSEQQFGNFLENNL